jgi:hypothetical protein
MKQVGLIKMCLNETHSKARVGSHLSDNFPIQNNLKQGDGLSPIFSSLILDYAIRKVQVKQVGLKLKETLQLLVYALNVNLLGITYTIKKTQKI